MTTGPGSESPRINTLNTGTQRRAAPAFTLIELVIVIFILSLTTALIMPNLWDTGDRAVKSEARRIGNTMRYLSDEAAGKKIDYHMTINLDKGTWGYESEKASRDFTMKNDVIFKDVIVPSVGDVSFGEIVLKFGPTGAEEPLILHLSKDEIEYTVMFNHINGRAKIYKGHVLWDEVSASGIQETGMSVVGSQRH